MPQQSLQIFTPQPYTAPQQPSQAEIARTQRLINAYRYGTYDPTDFRPELLAESLYVGIFDTAASTLKGVTAYTPAFLDNLDKELNSLSQSLRGVVPEPTRQRVVAAASGHMLPGNLSHIPEVLNTWSAMIGMNVPVMVQAQVGRAVGAAVGGLIAGPGGAVAGGVAGGVAAMSLLEAGNYLETADYAGIARSVSERHAAFYGLISGSIEYAQQAFMAKPFRVAFNKATGSTRQAMQGKVLKWIMTGKMSRMEYEAAGVLSGVLKDGLGITLEGVEEVAQSGVMQYMLKRSERDMQKLNPDYKLPELNDDWMREFAGGAGVALITRLTGGLLGSTLRPGLTIREVTPGETTPPVQPTTVRYDGMQKDPVTGIAEPLFTVLSGPLKGRGANARMVRNMGVAVPAEIEQGKADIGTIFAAEKKVEQPEGKFPVRIFGKAVNTYTPEAIKPELARFTKYMKSKVGPELKSEPKVRAAIDLTEYVDRHLEDQASATILSYIDREHLNKKIFIVDKFSVKDFGTIRRGWFDTKHPNWIAVGADAIGTATQFDRTVTHEILHDITVKPLMNPQTKADFKLKAEVSEARERYKKANPFAGGQPYMANDAEFFAHALTTQELSKDLLAMPSTRPATTSLWQQLVDAIANFLGIKPDHRTALDDIVNSFSTYLAETQKGTGKITQETILNRMQKTGTVIAAINDITEQVKASQPKEEASTERIAATQPGVVKEAIAKRNMHTVVGINNVNDLRQLNNPAAVRRLWQAQIRQAPITQVQLGYKFGRTELRQVLQERNEANRMVKDLRRIQQYIPTLDENYANQLEGLIGPYDLFRRSAKTLSRREGTLEFVNRMEAEGEQVFVPVDLIEAAQKIPLNNMSLDDLRTLHELATSLFHQARVKGKLIASKEAREIAQVKEELLASSAQIAKPKMTAEEMALRAERGPPTPTERRGDTVLRRMWERISEAPRIFAGALLKAETIFQKQDNWEDMAAWQRNMFEPAARSEDMQDRLRSLSYKWTDAAVKETGVNLHQMAKTVEAIMGRQLSHVDLLGVYVNSKNVDNLRSLVEGNRFTEEQIAAFIAAMPDNEKTFGDRLMQIVDWFWKDAEAVGYKLTGIHAKKVDNYWHKAIDPAERGTLRLKVESAEDLMRSTLERIYVDRRFMKERKGGVFPLNLDAIAVFTDHIDRVTHFISHGLAVRDIQKLLYSGDVRADIVRVQGEEAYKQLQSWLRYVAHPTQGYVSAFDKVIGTLRHNTTLAMLGIKAAVSLKQFGSITHTANRIGLGPTLKGLTEYMKHPIEMSKFIQDKSVFIANRRTKFDRELYDYMTKRRQDWGAERGKFFFSLISLVDKMATEPSWLGAYIASEGKYATEAERIAYADMIARRQPTASPKDLPAIQRGTQTHKMLTMFYTHFTNVYNEMYRTSSMWRQGQNTALDALVGYWWLWVMPALYALAVSRPKAFKEPKELVGGIMGYGAASIPVLGNLVQTAMSTRYEYTLTPIVQLPKEAIMATRATPGAIKAVVGTVTGQGVAHEDQSKLGTAFHHWLLTAGYAAGFPAPQMWITGTGIKDLATGETKNPLRLFLSEWSMEWGDGEQTIQLPATPARRAGSTTGTAPPQAPKTDYAERLQRLRKALGR